MVFLLLVITILSISLVVEAQPPSCGEVCSYEEQFQFADCSAIGLQEVPTEHGCESARFLHLHHNNIGALLENHMLGTRGALHLDFSFNTIAFVEPRSFAGCNSVTYLHLYLSSNQISVLQNETFSECEESLLQLHLDRNNLEIIESGALRNLTKLAHLFLGHNNLQTLEASIFHDLHSLMSLYLNSNRLTSLPGELFATLRRLKHLDLSTNNLVVLGDETFNQCCQLISIILVNNQLTSIPRLPKRPCLKRLQALDIRNNSIRDGSKVTQVINATYTLLIDGNPFHCDCNLEKLRVWLQQEATSSELNCIMPSSGESKHIQTLPALCPPATSLPGQKKPFGEEQHVIRSATNRADKDRQLICLLLLLVTFSTGSRISIVQILFILFAYTPVVLPAQPPSCGEVCYYDGQFQIADCSGIGLQTVPTKDGCESARLLDLSYNSITSLHENDGIGNRGAQHLDLSSNSISSVEPRSFSGSNIVIYLNLYLSSNQIAVLQNETFSECEESLQQLHLDRNNIAVIESGAFKSLTRLAHLFLGHNNLQSLEANVFQDLHSLESLYLNSNKLIFLPGDLFATLSRLKHLDLSSNKLVVLGDELFDRSCQLSTVVLANNRLRNIPNQSKSPCLSRLQAFDIRNNNISDASNITKYINATEKLFIDGNPFHCDCNLENLRKWVQQEVTSSVLKCIMPSSGESRDIKTLPALCPKESPHTNDVTEQTAPREEEQGDTNSQRARPEEKNKPKLPTYSRNVLVKQNQNEGDPAEDKKSGLSTSESLEDKEDGSWSAFVIVAIILASVVSASIIFIIIRSMNCKSIKEKNESPRKPSNTPDASTPMGSTKVDMSGVRYRMTPQSTDKMVDKNSPINVNTKHNLNASTIDSDHLRSLDENYTERENHLIRRLDNQYGASLPEVTESREECDDLGLSNILDSEDEGV